MAVSKETMLTTFKKWPLANDFDVNTSDGGVTSVVCKYDNIKEGALKSIGNFCKEVTYIS